MKKKNSINSIINGTQGYTEKLDSFFKDKVFIVPNYQRNYAWDYDNWSDLWDDIEDGIANSIPHYWGTITLKDTGKLIKPSPATSFMQYQIIDGQQRITTLYILLLALAESGVSDIHTNYIKNGTIYKLRLGTLNETYIRDLVDKTNNTNLNIKKIRTNQRLKDALEFFKKRIHNANANSITSYLVDFTFVLKFSIQDDSLAIQSFVNLNDRGKDLTLIEKTKGLLTFYCSRYLQNDYNQLEQQVNDTFATVFPNFDLIKDISKSEEIEYINSNNFIEDDILRMFYHYFAWNFINKYNLSSGIAYDSRVTSKGSYDYIKTCLDILRKRTPPTDMKNYINDFLLNLEGFSEALKDLINSVTQLKQIKKMLVFLGLSAPIYPLAITLKKEGLLDSNMYKLLENLDLRVFKVGGYYRIKPLYDILIRIKSDQHPNPNYQKIYNEIKNYIYYWMPDIDFKRNLNGEIYNALYTKYILWEYQKSVSQNFNDSDYSYYSKLSKEHIFAQQPVITIPSLGFIDDDEYNQHIHLIGNICLLESSLQKNPHIDNKPPITKAPVYESHSDSNMPETNQLGADIKTKGFDKNALFTRRDNIVDFCIKRWC